jgi:uncharacterized protein YjiS (DUF1127 family)
MAMPTNLPARAAWRPTGLARALRLALNLLRLRARWNERHRQRQALSELDDRMLRDIGVTRGQAERECEKPPWR